MIKSLLLSFALWQPTMDCRRFDLDAVIEPPYWLGVAAPAGFTFDVVAIQDGRDLFRYDNGCRWYLYYNESRAPIEFYDGGIYAGRIVPEPASVILLAAGLLLVKKRTAGLGLAR